MDCSFTDNHGYIICEVASRPNPLCGAGCFERPVFLVYLELLLRGPREIGRAVLFSTLQCRLSTDGKTHLAESRTNFLGQIVTTGDQRLNQSATIEIPIGRDCLANIEANRGTQDVLLHLDLELAFEELVQNGETEEFDKTVPVWGLLKQSRSVAQMRLDVPRSKWLEHVLPQTQFGRSYLIELPVLPIASVAECAKAFEALKKAQEHHKNGFYDASVFNCRQAIESLSTARREIAPGQSAPVLDEQWKTRLGGSTYTWLNDAFGALKRPANEMAHGRSSFDQFESQMVQMLTTALVAYAARSASKEEPL